MQIRIAASAVSAVVGWVSDATRHNLTDAKMTAKLKMFVASAAVLCAAGGLSAPRVLAESQEERQACIDDAFEFCMTAIPDRNNVLICLVEHRSQISAACRTVLASHASVGQASSKDNGNH